MRADEILVEIEGLKFEDSRYNCGDYTWDATTLVDAVKDLPEFDLPLIALDIGVSPWNGETIKSYAMHFRRVLDANLKYPVILDAHGFICDGWHRVVKALLLGRSTIKAKRLVQMPEPDQERSEKETNS